MQRIPVEEFNLTQGDDEDVKKAWDWFMAFISEKDWEKRKNSMEQKMSLEFRNSRPFSEPLTEGTLLVEKTDVIGWYLYLVDCYLHHIHKYEYFQGARIIPVFKRFGEDLDLLKSITGIDLKVKDLLKKRRLEADAFLFEMLVALLWARNGYEVAFVPESDNEKTPDIVAKKNGKNWTIECKRQSKTSDYTYRETAKRQKMISQIGELLIKRNLLLDIVFHVEIETLPDSYLKDLLKQKLPTSVPGKIISNAQVDIELSVIDISAIRAHLNQFLVKYNSPMLNKLIGGKPIDNKGFTCGVYANFFRIGDGEMNNLYISDIARAFGVYWTCDAEESLIAKARDIKNQVHSAMQQFSSDVQSVVHIGMETFDGPEVEMARFQKISGTIEQIDPLTTKLRYIYCHFFQAYSPPDGCWFFDETVSTLTPYISPRLPLSVVHLIVPEDSDTAADLSHWERPLPT